jgi:hypothetical protein
VVRGLVNRWSTRLADSDLVQRLAQRPPLIFIEGRDALVQQRLYAGCAMRWVEEYEPAAVNRGSAV